MSSTTTIFEINGVIDTEKTVWNNMELIAAAAASWISYDNTTGQYGVVINKPDTPVASFNDNNIIGAITLTETDYENIYNACEISFPNRDMFSRTDFIRFDEGVAARFDYEPDNTLTLSSDLIRDSVQADVLAITELKQSRQNKVISFSSDFTALAINPGDVIRITNDYWGWSNKLFRVTQMVEEDRDDGSIVVNITAIEYSDAVYAYNSITRFDRSTSTGIPSAEGNDTTKEEKKSSFATDTGVALERPETATAIQTKVVEVNTANNYPTLATLVQEASSAALESYFNSATAYPYNATTSIPGRLLSIHGDVPFGEMIYSYNFGGSTYNVESTVYFPLYYRLRYTTPDGLTTTLLQEQYKNAGESNFDFYVDNPPAGIYQLTLEATVGSIIPVPFDPTQTGVNLGTLNGIPNVYDGSDIVITPQYFSSIGPGPSSTYGNRVQWMLFF